MKKLKIILVCTVILTVFAFVLDLVKTGDVQTVIRNDYGNGSRKENFQLQVEGEEETQKVEVEVLERKYTKAETEKMFREIIEKLDAIVLDGNERFDHVEERLNLVSHISGYPANIRWELSAYDVLSVDGEVREEAVDEDGSMVEIRGIISYEGEEAIYVRTAMLYPKTRVGEEKLLHDIQEEIAEVQEETRSDESFTLPSEVAGRTLTWSKEEESNWYYVPIIGMTLAIWLVYREKTRTRKLEQRRMEATIREYPALVSKLTMLLGAGGTLKQAWEKIVQSYEKQKTYKGVHLVYEEMGQSLRQMQSGVTEAEAYENFGKRCGSFAYLKFGALLSQNLRKGSQGLIEILRMEAIQAFESRKNTAKRMGEEAGTKLLMPMFGMLAVVFIMVMVPAFLSMQF